LKHVPIDASLKPPKDFKTEISEFIVGLIFLAVFVVFIGIIVWDCAWAARPIQLALGNGTRSGLVALDRAGKH